MLQEGMHAVHLSLLAWIWEQDTNAPLREGPKLALIEFAVLLKQGFVHKAGSLLVGVQRPHQGLKTLRRLPTRLPNFEEGLQGNGHLCFRQRPDAGSMQCPVQR